MVPVYIFSIERKHTIFKCLDKNQEKVQRLMPNYHVSICLLNRKQEIDEFRNNMLTLGPDSIGKKMMSKTLWIY